jgi:hypothetical protein
MKIGLSVSKCVLDIVEERVSIDDVLLIIGGTNFDPSVDADWNNIWRGYTDLASFYNSPVWYEWAEKEGAEDKFRSIILQLWNDGKIHQPRKFGARLSMKNITWLDVYPSTNDFKNNPSVQSAWEKFQTVAGLSGIKIRNMNQ